MKAGTLPPLCVILLTTATLLNHPRAFAAPTTDTESLLQRVGVTKGICVVLGDPGATTALALADKTESTLYLQYTSAEEAEKARQAVDAKGLLGTRIYVEAGKTMLYMGDNLADGVIAVGEPGFTQAEMLRVLRPGGKALVKGTAVTKPAPAGLDDWSHPYHGPDNNPASKDQLARAPYLTQFLAEPRYAPLPQVAVASAGRVFKAFGHIAFKVREEPWLNTLAAFNGYNGTLLWRREITPGLMVHRNCLVATPTTVFFADDKSCKVYDAATGELKTEIIPPEEVAGGTFWKWLALENGVLYALIGDQEKRDPTIRVGSEGHGWPWDPLSPGFNSAEHTWGFGRTVLAIDPNTSKVLWSYREKEPIDSRALCMKNGCLFAFRFGSYLTCLETSTGRTLWRQTPENGPELFKALGPYSKRQDWRTNWRTTAYLKASDQALYFSGPTVEKLAAVSTETGKMLWEYPYNNYQLVLFDDALYGVSGEIDKDPSRKFDPLTGKVLGEFKIGRRACTRPTASCDAIFFRAGEGSTRLDLASNQPELVSPMRAQCHDGVTVANGLLYWWPSVCDCNLSLYGITCLGGAGNFQFNREAVESERLERKATKVQAGATSITKADWPVFRANNTANSMSEAAVPTGVRTAWEYQLPQEVTPTPATTVGDMIYVSGSDGVVRALNGKTGKAVWTGYTGGAIRFPPTIADGRAFVGSGDGHVYAFDAETGAVLWRFRAAPIERRIPVYGQLMSTWPAASGILVEKGVVYAAAGLANYDGTHVYALEAATGAIRWQNNNSGHLDAASRTGVGVQGQMMILGDKLYLAGGNAVSPAIYEVASGKCLSELNTSRQMTRNNVIGAIAPRGWELYQVGDQVRVSGKPFYAHPQYGVFDGTVLNKTFVAAVGERDVAWINNTKLACYEAKAENRFEPYLRNWGKVNIPNRSVKWEVACPKSVAIAVTQNAALLANGSEVKAINLQDGKTVWTHSVPAAPVPWGLAVNREGRVVVSLENGRVLCLAK